MTQPNVSLDKALDVVLASVRPVEVERAGVINTPGRTLAEDVAADGPEGVCLIPKGTLIGGSEMAALAAIGKQGVLISRRPRVSIITTGDEVVDLMERLGPGLARNVNRYSLAGRVFASGCEIGRLLHAGDDPGQVKRAIQACRVSDAVIITEGVSLGKPECVHDVVAGLGDTLFTGVEMEPEGPSAFAIVAGAPVFVLPGEPESAAIVFDVLVRPALLTLLGRREICYPVVQATAESTFSHTAGRRAFVASLAVLENGRLIVKSPESTVTENNCLTILPEAQETVAVGDLVDVVLLKMPVSQALPVEPGCSAPRIG